MNVKSVRAGEYTAPPAHGPMIREIWGMTPDAMTFLCQKRKVKISGYRDMWGIMCRKIKATIKLLLAFTHRNSILEACLVSSKTIYAICPHKKWNSWPITVWGKYPISSPSLAVVPQKLHQNMSSYRAIPLSHTWGPAPPSPQSCLEGWMRILGRTYRSNSYPGAMTSIGGPLTTSTQGTQQL